MRVPVCIFQGCSLSSQLHCSTITTVIAGFLKDIYHNKACKILQRPIIRIPGVSDILPFGIGNINTLNNLEQYWFIIYT